MTSLSMESKSMKMGTAALIVGTLFLGTAAVAADKSTAVSMMASDLAWKDNAAMKGSQWAALWGDATAGGAWAAFKKVPAGTVLPAHTHTLDSKVVMMKGTMNLTLEGAAPKAMGP